MRIGQIASLLFLAIGFGPMAQAAITQADRDFKQSVDNCILSQFDAADSPRLNATIQLEDACPTLHARIGKSPAVERLEPGLMEVTSLNQLLDIQYHLQILATPVTATKVIDPSLLTDMAREFNFNSLPSKDVSWWDKLLEWLKATYSDDGKDDEMDWLIELLENLHFPDWLGEAIYYTSMGLIIILALVIVINELRHYHRTRTQQKVQAAVDDDHSNQAESYTLQWENLRQIPLALQPAAILRVCIDALIDLGLLTNNKSHTNREFWRELRTTDPTRAPRFAQAIDLAEQDLYGGLALDQDGLDSLYSAADNLLHKQPEKS